MTTYQLNVTLANVSPSASGAYPLAENAGSYIANTSLVFKEGDTIRVKVTHPLGLPIRYTNTETSPNNYNNTPDPSNLSPSLNLASPFNGSPATPHVLASQTLTAGSLETGRQYIIKTVGSTTFTSSGAGNNNVGTNFTATNAGSGSGTVEPVITLFPSGKVFELTWSASYAPDSLTRWFFFGRDAEPGTAAYSNEARLRKVSAQMTASGLGNVISGSGRTNEIVKGGYVTFNLGSLNTSESGYSSSGSYANRFYVSVYSNAGLVTTLGNTGVTWDSSGFAWGEMGTADTNVVLTVGGDMAAGPYTAYLTHFNPASEGATPSTVIQNRFVGAENRVGNGVAFYVVTPPAPDTTPDAFTMGPNVTTSSFNTLVTSAYITVAGLGQNQTTVVQINGGEYQINAGSWTTSATYNGVANGDTVRLRTTSSHLAGTASQNVFISIGFVLGTNSTDGNNYWVVTTAGTSGGDSNPDSFRTALGNLTHTGVATGDTTTTNIVTLAGTNTAAPIVVSGGGSPQYRYRADAASTFISYTSSAGSIPPGYQFQFKVTASSSPSTNVAGTLSIGSSNPKTGTLSVTTAASTGSTGPSGGAASAGDYGLEVRNAAGDVVFSPSNRVSNFVSSGLFTVAASGASATTNDLPAEGMTTNASSDMAVLTSDNSAASNAGYSPAITILRGNGTFKIRNDSGSAFSGSYIVLRY